MTLTDARAGARILLLAGTFGVCAEVAWVRFGILSGFIGPGGWDRALGEIAFAVVTYGAIFGLAAVAILYPDLAVAPQMRSHGTLRGRWMKDHSATLWMILIVLVPLAILREEMYFVEIGVFSPEYAVSSLVHLLPFVTFWAAAFTFNGGTRSLHHVPEGR
jgi:hypothetical protein